MDVALLTEGTYPTSHGGVSVWCDQLVAGLAEHRFDVYAITGTPAERPLWELPPNVRNVRLIPLWGGTGERPRRLTRRERQRFADAYDAFIGALTAPQPDVDGFLRALRGLWEFAMTADLGQAFRSEETVRRLLAAWATTAAQPSGAGKDSQDHLRPTIADAVNATSLLEHLLRPLTVTPRQVALTHSAANGLGALLAMTTKWTYGTPFILTEHGVYLRERYLAYRKSNYSRPVKQVVLRFFKLLTDAAYRVADLITPGNSYNQRWALRGGAPREIIRTVYNGVDPAEFPAVVGEPDVPTVSFMGRIDPIKDVETLVRSFATVRAAIPEARLRIFGGAPKGGEAYLARCKAAAAEIGAGDQIVFEGRVAHARDAYAAGHVVALTSISEGFPYTVVEAMISGRATVSTDVGGVSEAVGDTGLLVPPRDPEAFGAACVELLQDHARRRALGVGARRRALQLFTLENFLDIYRGIYDEVGGRSPASIGPRALDPATAAEAELALAPADAPASVAAAAADAFDDDDLALDLRDPVVALGSVTELAGQIRAAADAAVADIEAPAHLAEVAS